MYVQIGRSDAYYIVAGQLNKSAKIHSVDAKNLVSECGVDFENREFIRDEIEDIETLLAIAKEPRVCSYCKGIFNDYAKNWSIDFKQDKVK